MSGADGGGPAMDPNGRPIGPDGKPIPGPDQIRQIQAERKMKAQQDQVDEVIGIMHKNVENVLERDAKLGALEERADALQDGAAQFEKQAGSLKNKFWMENLKSMIAMGVVGLLLLGMLYWKFSDDATAPAYPYPMPPMPYPPPQAAPVPPGGGGSGGAAAAQGGP